MQRGCSWFLDSLRLTSVQKRVSYSSRRDTRQEGEYRSKLSILTFSWCWRCKARVWMLQLGQLWRGYSAKVYGAEFQNVLGTASNILKKCFRMFLKDFRNQFYYFIKGITHKSSLFSYIFLEYELCCCKLSFTKLKILFV